MSLRIAFDLDGTVADMYVALRREAEHLFGDDVLSTPAPRLAANGAEEAAEDPDNPAVAQLSLTARQEAQLWGRVKEIENCWLGLPEVEPGIIARIARLAEARRWEVIFITTRPSSAGDTTQVQTARWLEAHGYSLPSAFVVHGSRGKVAEALSLDFVVDDRPENCLDVAVDSKAKPILVGHADDTRIPAGAKRLGVRVAPSIGAAVDLIEKYDDIRTGGGMVKSIKKLFGRGHEQL